MVGEPLRSEARVEQLRPAQRPARPSESAASSCSGYDAPPVPPGDVQSSARRSTRSGHVTASSCATIPPKLTPTTERDPSPRGRGVRRRRRRSRPSSTAGAVLALPQPRWSCTSTSKSLVNSLMSSSLVSIDEPDPLKNSRRGPSPRSLVVEVDPVGGDGRHGRGLRRGDPRHGRGQYCFGHDCYRPAVHDHFRRLPRRRQS